MDAFIAFLRTLTAENLKDGNVYYDKNNCRFWLGIGATEWSEFLANLDHDAWNSASLFYVTKEVDTDLWWGYDDAENRSPKVSGMKKVKINLYEYLEDALCFYGYYNKKWVQDREVTITDEGLEKVIGYICEKIENWEKDHKEKFDFPFWWYSDFKGFVE